MSTQKILTFLDALEHLTDTASGISAGLSQSQMNRCVQAAYQEVMGAHDWPNMFRPCRRSFQASQTTGTLAYTHSTRTAVLTSGTATVSWPSWAVGSTVWVDSKMCEVESVASDLSSAVFSAAYNPGEDLSGETYEVYQRWVELPADFRALTQPISNNLVAATKCDLDDMLKLHIWRQGTSTEIQKYAFGPSLINPQVPAMYVWPGMSAAFSLDFVYRKRARDLRYTGNAQADNVGSIAVTAGEYTATGTSTSFASAHVGSILRIGTSSVPTSRFGPVPFVEEHEIVSVTDQVLTLRTPIENAGTGLKYLITDPIDLDEVAHQAFLHCCDKHLVKSRAPKLLSTYRNEYFRAISEAKAACHKGGEQRYIGGPPTTSTRLKDIASIQLPDGYEFGG